MTPGRWDTSMIRPLFDGSDPKPPQLANEGPFPQHHPHLSGLIRHPYGDPPPRRGNALHLHPGEGHARHIPGEPPRPRADSQRDLVELHPDGRPRRSAVEEVPGPCDASFGSQTRVRSVWWTALAPCVPNVSRENGEREYPAHQDDDTEDDAPSLTHSVTTVSGGNLRVLAQVLSAPTSPSVWPPSWQVPGIPLRRLLSKGESAGR